MRNLPEEVILEILLWLPVKSLLRFRCVSKSWLSLISNPQFAKSHFERSSIHTDRLIYIAANEARSIDFEGSFHDDSSVVKLNFPLTAPSYRIHIMGSCRGFLLLQDAGKLFVWNPSTGLCKTLSYPPMSSELYPFIYGFGYDSSTDDYLVVLASYDVDSANIVTRFEFFSLRNNSWKEIEGTHFSFMNAVDDPKGGVLLNGVVHWLVYDANALTAVVLAFNLIGKNLREVPMPDDFDYNLEFCDFGVLGGCLSLSIVDESTTEIWIMKEYEVKSSWSKSITISVEEIGTDYFSPICFTNGGEIVGTAGSTGLIKFSREGELLEQCAYCHDGLWCEVAVYTQSLLPLPSDSEEEGEDKQH